MVADQPMVRLPNEWSISPGKSTEVEFFGPDNGCFASKVESNDGYGVDGKTTRLRESRARMVSDVGIVPRRLEAKVLQFFPDGLARHFQPSSGLRLIPLREPNGAGEELTFHFLKDFGVDIQFNAGFRLRKEFIHEGLNALRRGLNDGCFLSTF